MTSAVPVQCTCGHVSTAQPSELGRPFVCPSCGASFVAWPLEASAAEASSATWFVRAGAHELGPFDEGEIERLVAEGRITTDTPVRRTPDDPWIVAEDAGLLGAALTGSPPVAMPVAAPIPVAPPIAEALPVAPPVVEPHERASSRRRHAAPARAAKKRSPALAIAVAVGIVAIGLGAWAALGSGSDGDGSSTTAEGGNGPDGGSEAPPPTLDEHAARVSASVVRVKGRLGEAAGFVVAPGVIATSRRLLADERMEDVQLEAGQPASAPAKLRYVDPELDLAFLDLEDEVAPVTFATKVSLAPGTEVGVVGYAPPTGSDGAAAVLTRGACRSRVLLGGRPHNLIEVPASSPCSGCPVMDGDGDVIGMVTCVASAEDKQCVFIPLASLKASLDHALKMPDSERERTVAHHRLARLGRRLWSAMRLYGETAQTYLTAMQDAVAKGQEPTEGIAAVKEQVEARLKTIDEELPSDLTDQLAAALDDSTLHDLTVRRMKRLQAAFEGLRAHLADPPSDVQSYRRRQEHWAYEANTAGRELLEADGLRLESP